MKSIGFIDYYISEWHANNYPAWIKEAAAAAGLDYEVKYVYAEEYVSPVYGENTDEWCARFGAEHCDSIAELCQKADVIVILAPSNPEKHLEYAKEALKYGKRTYIDKTFAPDYKTAKEIFELGEKFNTPFFSSSALRYSDALCGLENVKNVTVFGGGSNFAEYAVHLIEIAVKLISAKPLSLSMKKSGSHHFCHIDFAGGKSASLVYAPPLSYAVAAECEDGKHEYRDAKSGHFQHLIADILNFFETGELSFQGSETLDVMKIRGAAIAALEKQECVISLQD
jgi:hypothetical protein